MNLRDLIIIYLACGAPFGVYYFLQNRNRADLGSIWLKTLIRFLFWIPFALRMVARKSLFTNLYNKGFDGAAGLDAKADEKIEKFRKFFEAALANDPNGPSLFELREVFDRYVGLTRELRAGALDAAETDLFRVAGHPDRRLAEICLGRRNRARLFFHQRLARRDFFETARRFLATAEAPADVLTELERLADMLNDREARPLLEELSRPALQRPERKNVKHQENDLWNSANRPPLPDTRISTSMQVLTATANLSNKD